jgi:hypothetical protein
VFEKRVDTLRLKLQMAMFRIRTNQLKTPLSDLVLPASSSTPMPRTWGHSDLPSTPPPRPGSSSTETTEEDDVPVTEVPVSSAQKRMRIEDEEDEEDISTVVKESAVSELLELNKARDC